MADTKMIASDPNPAAKPIVRRLLLLLGWSNGDEFPTGGSVTVDGGIEDDVLPKDCWGG